MTKMEIIDFKSIRNYIHNYLGLTKSEVIDIIEEELHKIVQEEIKKLLNDKQKLTNYIQQEIIKEISRDYNKQRHSYPISTMDEVYNKIDTIIHQEVLKRLVIELREPPKEDDLNER